MVQIVDRNAYQSDPSSRAVRRYGGCLYYAGMRPEEAARLKKSNLAIPKYGWGDIHLEGAEPYAAKSGPTAVTAGPASA